MNTTFRITLLGLVGLSLAGCPQVPPADPLPAAPRVTSFKASASQVNPGDTVSLSWAVEHATDVRIDELTLGAISGVSGNEGSVDVAISRDATFVLTVRNARGASDSAVVSVLVAGAAREILFAALPPSIAAGDDTTLVWTAPNAAAVSITGNPGGAVDLGGQVSAGSVTVRPVENTIYTLTADGRTRDVTVTVGPAITALTVEAEPAADAGSHDAGVVDAGVTDAGVADAGAPLIIRWSTTGATRVQLKNATGTLADVTDAAQVASGSYRDTLPVKVDRGEYFNYELIATNASGGTISRSVTYAVPGSPVIVNFTVPSVVRFTDGGTFNVSWQTLQTDIVSIEANDVEIYRAPSDAIDAGVLQVPVPSVDTTYTLKARGVRGGQAVRSALVDAVGPPTVTLTASPTNPNPGDTVTLSWAGEHIRNVKLREVGFDPQFVASGMLDTGSTTVTLGGGSTTFVIEVDNAQGDRASAMLALAVNNPITLTVAETGALRFGQNITVAVAGGTGDLVGLPHSNIDVRPGSTGFDDISTTGTLLSFPSSSVPATITTDFRMPFYGRVVGSNINVARHGFLGFTDLNNSNYINEIMPSPWLEDLVIAPYWESMASAAVRWEVKAGVLIVQWDTTTISTQAKLYPSGQVDFEYRTLPPAPTDGGQYGSVAITGVEQEQTLVPSVLPAVGTGFTFFGPRTPPVTIKAVQEGPVLANLVTPNGLVRVAATLPTVVRPDQLVVNEVLAGSTGGANGQWVELRNLRRDAIDLAGWDITLADGGVLPLSGTVPASGLLVLGATTDNALNGNANVQVAVPGFNLSGEPRLKFGRGGLTTDIALAGTAGTAKVHGLGPWLDGTATTPFSESCDATASFGTWAQFGTPGTDSHCGFPYSMARTTAGYFDISTTGTPLFTSFDTSSATVSTVAAPVPFFGTPYSSMWVNTNGVVGFTATSSSSFPGAAPLSTSTPNLFIAPFAADLTQFDTAGQGFVQRVGQGVDPYANEPHWIVEWHRYTPWSSTCTSNLNFQVKFFDDGVIEVHYGKMVSATYDGCAIGILASSWLENAAGDKALVINSRSINPGIRPYTAYRFVPR